MFCFSVRPFAQHFCKNLSFPLGYCFWWDTIRSNLVYLGKFHTGAVETHDQTTVGKISVKIFRLLFPRSARVHHARCTFYHSSAERYIQKFLRKCSATKNIIFADIEIKIQWPVSKIDSACVIYHYYRFEPMSTVSTYRFLAKGASACKMREIS